MKQFKMTVLDWSVLALVIVGAINWGLVGVGYFVDSAANWNLVNIALGSIPELEFLVYALVGLAGIYGVYFATRISGVRIDETDEMTERVTPK
ncbi:DUF378 domain-containing protein [Halorubellus salinus]|uniref:DUF378 domain-containing protein n=1 Tax=Halorubellus salinus TaxID=755309 RepID=UPI001D06D1A5|nr:DUF378 domain-containing protein [Halorubellus salinus]